MSGLKLTAACLIVMLSALSGAQSDGYKRYKDEGDKAQMALERKAPPAIVASEWLNSKPLNWSALKGKVVLVDLWAYW